MAYYSTDPTLVNFEKGFLSDDNMIQDPTYVGFKILFDFSINSPLFYDGTDSPSAAQYLRDIGLFDASAKLVRFTQLLQKLSKNADYYFQTLRDLG